jgi:hypothetical protein
LFVLCSLGPFFQYLITNGIIASSRYVAGVEVGTEIVNGTGSAIFNSFSASASPCRTFSADALRPRQNGA